MKIVWDTASIGSYGGTVFPGVVHYSLVNNVCGIRYSLGYRITLTPVALCSKAAADQEAGRFASNPSHRIVYILC